MPKTEFLQLAHVYNPKKHSIFGRFMSEKLDGQRAFWDGGVSRGLFKKDVPWANNARDERYKEVQVATGLWSRYGNVIHAPGEFLDRLPPILLDGELYAGRGGFQKMRKIVADLNPGPGWRDIQYIVLDSPPHEVVFADREINTTNFKRTLKGCLKFYVGLGSLYGTKVNSGFGDRLAFLRQHVSSEPGPVYLHEQRVLSFNPDEAKRQLADGMETAIDLGGEGVILKSQSALYECVRSWSVLKVKPANDAEGTVVGAFWGDYSDNTRTKNGDASGKLLGKMGSLLVEFRGHRFKLAGFTDEERKVRCEDGEQVGIGVPGAEIDPEAYRTQFPAGSVVTFTYRELSDDGIPKEARYLRGRDGE